MTLHIEMVSDLVCPWCWVGLRRLKAAINQVPELNVQILFRPYELDESIPPGGVDYNTYMQARFGTGEGRSRASQMKTLLIEYGQAENIPFRFEKITRRPNSFNAHRLVRWAQGQNLGSEAKEALFEAVFSKGQDIGDHETLVTLASSIGLDANIISDLLVSDADVADTRAEQKLFRDMGVSGVPTFIAHRRIAMQGAETVHKLTEFLTTAAAQMPQECPAS